MKKLRVVIIAVFICLCAVVACACSPKPIFYSVEYISQDGGIVYGDINQSVRQNDSGTEVVAVANEGYEFVGWSDGIMTATRFEDNVNEKVIVTAQFDKIIKYELT